MCRGTRKPRGLKVRLYAARLIEINEYLDALPGAKASVNVFVAELNVILLNNTPHIWINQAYMQGFYFESTT